MKKCNIQGVTVQSPSVTSKALQSDLLWTKKPRALTLDFSVSSDACRLYDFLCIENYKREFRTNLVTVSTRPVAEVFTVSPMTISRWLKSLCSKGYLEKLSGRGQALTYKLLSPVHEYRAKVDTMLGATAEVASRDLAVVRDKKRKCLKCGNVGRIVSTSGACDACMAEWVQRLASA